MSPVPMPPIEFQTLVCGPGSEPLFGEVGCWLRDALQQQDMLGPNANVLDVGCGCERLACALLDAPIGSYIGFGRHEGMVDWSSQEISSREPCFRFDFFDLKSFYVVWDKQAGSIDAEKFRFPYADGAFDSVILALSSHTCPRRGQTLP
jgi:SAM-dependent methyltransferase